MEVYADYAATTPVKQEVIDAMMEIYQSHFGNPSSIHSIGRDARKYLDQSRRTVAQLLGANPNEVIFTSGVNKNGITIIGFNTTGKPNVTISLIPKMPGIKANRPSFFIRSDFARKTIKNTRDNVLPPPPKLPKKSPKGPVKMFGNG